MRWLAWWRPPCVLRTVIINFRGSDEAIKAVLWSSRGQWLTFKQTSLLKAGQPPVPMDGDVVIHRDRVLFMQVLP